MNQEYEILWVLLVAISTASRKRLSHQTRSKDALRPFHAASKTLFQGAEGCWSLMTGYLVGRIATGSHGWRVNIFAFRSRDSESFVTR